MFNFFSFDIGLLTKYTRNVRFNNAHTKFHTKKYALQLRFLRTWYWAYTAQQELDSSMVHR